MYPLKKHILDQKMVPNLQTYRKVYLMSTQWNKEQLVTLFEYSAHILYHSLFLYMELELYVKLDVELDIQIKSVYFEQEIYLTNPLLSQFLT